MTALSVTASSAVSTTTADPPRSRDACLYNITCVLTQARDGGIKAARTVHDELEHARATIATLRERTAELLREKEAADKSVEALKRQILGDNPSDRPALSPGPFGDRW